MGWQTFSVIQLFAGDTIINPTGTFVYSGTPATGNLIASMTPAAGTDQFGNTYVQGIASYNGAIITQMANGGIGIQTVAGQIAGGFEGTLAGGVAAGQVILASGGNSLSDQQAQIVLDSTSVAGATQVNLSATNVLLNNFAVSTIPSANTFPGHQSAAPAAYSQSYENASTNRINEIMDVLTQCGIWHT